MQKTLARVLVAAVPALILSACNSSNGATGVSALPNASAPAVHHLRPHDTANDLEGGGATFPAQAYNGQSQPVGSGSSSRPGPAAGSIFSKVLLPNSGVVYYCLTGSGTGMGIFTVGSKAQSNGTTATTTGPCAPLGATPTGFGANQDPPDFGASDVAMSSGDYSSYRSVREPSAGTTWGEPLQIPVIGGPVVFAYVNQSSPVFPHTGKRVHFSRWAYCAVANGTISNWNDAALTRDNGGSLTGGVSEPITFYFRSDGSGTSYNFTYHLATNCQGPWPAPYNAAPYESAGRTANWPYGYSKNWPGPGSSAHPNAHFVGESGNPGVLAAIQSTAFSTGYVEGAYAAGATSPSVAQAFVQSATNSTGGPIYSDPTNATDRNEGLSYLTSADVSTGQGSDGNPLSGDTAPQCALYISPQYFTNPAANSGKTTAYPINAVSYMLFYGHNNGVRTKAKQDLAHFMLGSTAHTVEASEEYTPLPSTIVSLDKTAVTNCLK